MQAGPRRATCCCLSPLLTQLLQTWLIPKENSSCSDKSLLAHRNSWEFMSVCRLGQKATFWLQCSPVLSCPVLSHTDTSVDQA